MLRLITLLFLFASICFSQQDNTTKQPNQIEGQDVITKARQTIGLDKVRDTTSFSYKLKTTLISQNFNYESFEEAHLKLPDKIQAVYRSDKPFFGQLIRTWNDGKYKATFESDSSSGERTFKDITAEETKPVSKALSDVIGKKSASSLQEARKTDPKVVFTDSLWISLFPLILSHPFEKNTEFKYVGKAKSNDKTANVVDVKPANGKTYRLLFDSETNYLLMMIVSFRESNPRFVGDVETKYYFSERELTDGVLIPKKIKVESKSTPEGKSPVIKYSNIEIVDFKINPKFDEKIFETK